MHILSQKVSESANLLYKMAQNDDPFWSPWRHQSSKCKSIVFLSLYSNWLFWRTGYFSQVVNNAHVIPNEIFSACLHYDSMDIYAVLTLQIGIPPFTTTITGAWLVEKINRSLAFGSDW